MDNKQKRIVFMGSSDFSLISLKRMCESDFNIVAVYSREPKPTGRNYKIQKTVVHSYAEERNIPVFTPKTLRNSEQEEIFRQLNPEIAVVAAYGLIIPQNFLDMASFINIHASLLPRWRGAAPIQAAILAGDKETGISIMKMDAGLDTGDVISMKSIPITSETSFGDLSKSMAELGADMICKTLENFSKETLQQAEKQSDEGSCYASKISKDMCKLNWEDDCITNLRKIKAFSPDPGAWQEYDGIRIKILDAKMCSEVTPKDFVVRCSDGFLNLTSVQPAGKRVMSGQDFIRGRKNK